VLFLTGFACARTYPAHAIHRSPQRAQDLASAGIDITVDLHCHEPEPERVIDHQRPDPFVVHGFKRFQLREFERATAANHYLLDGSIPSATGHPGVHRAARI